MNEVERQKLEVLELIRLQDLAIEEARRLVREAADLLAALLAELEEVVP